MWLTVFQLCNCMMWAFLFLFFIFLFLILIFLFSFFIFFIFYFFQELVLCHFEVSLLRYAVCIYCVVMPLHNGQVESLPPLGAPPTRQVSTAWYMFLCSPHSDQ